MFKPMLSANVEGDLSQVKFPVLASPKLDGIRITIVEGQVLTRSLKPVPNKYINSKLNDPRLNGYDGEIIVGDIADPELYRKTMSAVMSEDGEPDFTFLVFDNYLLSNMGFANRLREVALEMAELKLPFLDCVVHHEVKDKEALAELENKFIGQKYEGLMMRKPNGLYKQGRSTLKEFGLVKWVRVETEEGEVVGFEERMHNANEAKINALGHTERSSHKANKIGRGDLGTLLLKNPKYTELVRVGTGFTDVERAEIWNNKEKFLGKSATYQYRPYGAYDAPRFAAFKGFRDERDMS